MTPIQKAISFLENQSGQPRMADAVRGLVRERDEMIKMQSLAVDKLVTQLLVSRDLSEENTALQKRIKELEG